MQRRDFLKMGGASFAVGATGMVVFVPRAHAATVTATYYITAGFITMKTASSSTSVYHRGFSQSSNSLDVPGQPIVAQEGDTIQVTVHNTRSQGHRFTIDGVVNQYIGGNQSKTFSFPAPSAGSYLFYDSSSTSGSSEANRLVGLHGGMAIMPAGSGNQLYAGSPTFVQQYFWVFNDIDPTWNNRVRYGQQVPSTFTPTYFTINGLTSKPPGHPDYADPDRDAMANPDTALHGHIGDRTLIRLLNAGRCTHSVHWHANHVEWLTKNGVIRPDVWKKDTLKLDNGKGGLDVIFPFHAPPDAWPPVSTGMYPMHLHDEMTQTAGGGSYMFGAMTELIFE